MPRRGILRIRKLIANAAWDGTIGLLEQAAARGLIELPLALARLRQTNARLDSELIRAALARDQARKQSQ